MQFGMFGEQVFLISVVFLFPAHIFTFLSYISKLIINAYSYVLIQGFLKSLSIYCLYCMSTILKIISLINLVVGISICYKYEDAR